ncbi:MAG: glycosyltransferase family 39 protein [Candidatus Hydrogenedentes bacterium]|nr:glycosyltransferase family 39 protein [Candidatus Hydrogenedentota bacterium]
MRFFWVLLVLACFVAFFELGHRDIVTDTEGMRAAPAAEMLRSGDFVIPTLNGERYLAKPPLLYWTIAGAYKLTGSITALTARIPSALSGILLALAAYLVFRREAGEMAARWTAFTLIASPYVLERMRLAEIDIPLTLMTFLAMVGLRYACLAKTLLRSATLTLAAGAALGAAVLLKGPVPLLFVTAAAVGHVILEGPEHGRAIRLAVIWSVVAGAVAFVYMFYPLPVPIPLLLVCGVWIYCAWRYGGGRLKTGVILGITIVLGIAIAAPWGAAVLHRVGWERVQELFRGEVVERTYVASRINAGDPLYYFYGLPLALAPWGLLLPMHASRLEWRHRPGVYRFCVLTGWLSITIFSMIAGKEYKYVLPAVPFLLLATGCHLSALNLSLRERWVAIWLRALPYLLPLAATVGAVLITRRQPFPSLWISVWGMALAMVVALLYRRYSRRLDLSRIAFMGLMAVMIWQLSRCYLYTGEKSPKALGEECRLLIENGYTVESAKVYPGLAFYAATTIPVEQNPERVQLNLAGPEPYYYVAAQSVLAPLISTGDSNLIRYRSRPFTGNKLVLIGNRPLPDFSLKAATR